MIARRPADVTAPLRDFLEGNIYKVPINAFIWLPCLICPSG